MSLSLRFELTDRNAGSRVSGLSRGHATLEGPGGRVTSAGRTPDQSMLVYLALVDLLDGIGDLMAASSRREWQWVGNDSSFAVNFRRSNGGVLVHAMGEPLGAVDEAALVQAIWDGATGLLAEHRPPPSDLIADDLDAALEEFAERFDRSP
jgi:hypothetical protein